MSQPSSWWDEAEELLFIGKTKRGGTWVIRTPYQAWAFPDHPSVGMVVEDLMRQAKAEAEEGIKRIARYPAAGS